MFQPIHQPAGADFFEVQGIDERRIHGAVMLARRNVRAYVHCERPF